MANDTIFDQVTKLTIEVTALRAQVVRLQKRIDSMTDAAASLISET